MHYSGLLIIRGEKSQISRDFWRQIRGENGRFRGNFRGKFSAKNKEESQEERFQKKRYIGRMSNSGQERKHKSLSNTVLKAIGLVSSYKKNISWLYRVNLLFQLQFRAEHSNAINFFSLLGLLCCFAVYKARLFVIEGSNPLVKSKHCCVSRVSCTYD